MVFGADYIIFFGAILILILSFKGGIKKGILPLVILGMVFTYVIVNIIHLSFPYPRPFLTYQFIPLIKPVAGSSFPSFHAASMATFAFSLSFVKSKYAFLLWFLFLWVGLSRVFVGVHYPIDILGGLVVGFLSSFLAWRLKEKLPWKNK